jgi:predicted nicotinamide N-methyase
MEGFKMEKNELPVREKIKKKKLAVELPGKTFKFEVVANIEDLITDVTDEDQVPCWADIWPASYGLARFIWETLSFGPGEEALELGAGMGLPGIVCAAKGLGVTLSDFNTLALELAAENARKNEVKVVLLQEDWRTFACRKQFDYLLASDILYDPKLNPFLGDIFKSNLKQGGNILISHPERQVTYRFLEKWLADNPFHQEIFSIDVELTGTLLPRYKIAVHLLRSCGGLKKKGVGQESFC